ncbi:hypothetical protein FRC07_011814 [Ceratobasidium sp. 392]|nr:hypothetical protein FRC07_011814 [Ceratobasidium sp. 392]
MKFSLLAAALATVSAVNAHAVARVVFHNGIDLSLGVGKYIRGPDNNNPVKDVKSKDIVCNAKNSPVDQTIEVKANDQITFEWSHDTRNDDIIDGSHKGPVLAWIASTSSNGFGSVWHKLFDEGFTNGQWAVDKLKANGGHITIIIPDLAAGEYLLRPEIIALHEADTDFAVNPVRGAQFYMDCVQIKIVSSGSVTLGAGLDFQKDYKSNGQGILFNLYGADPTTYKSPGGALAPFAVTSQPGIKRVTPGTQPTTAAPQPTTTATPAPKPTTTTTGNGINPPLTNSRFTTVTTRSTTTNTAAPTPTSGTGTAVAKYGQCGGIGYTGSTVCAAGSTYRESGDTGRGGLGDPWDAEGVSWMRDRAASRAREARGWAANPGPPDEVWWAGSETGALALGV